jgi:predicted RNase H-like HicB family nuclease
MFKLYVSLNKYFVLQTRMLTYKAIYKFLDEGVHGEVLDFPGTISFAENLEKVRRSLANALVEMAETNLINGEPLPKPDPLISDPEADLEEPIHLILTAASRIKVIPDLAAS